MSFLLLFVLFNTFVIIYSNPIIIDEGYVAELPTIWNYNYSQVASACPITCTTKEPCGPNCWYQADKLLLSNCHGKSQSPINIVQAVKSDPNLKYPDFQVNEKGCNRWTQFANDHAFEVNFSEENNICEDLYFEFNDEKFVLLQLHFHSPSEHTIGDGHADAEVHLVHKGEKSNKLVVLAILLSSIPSNDKLPLDLQGNTFLRNFLDVAEKTNPHHKDKYSHKYQVSNYPKHLHIYEELLPASREYYTYVGSLTTVPCTQGVRFIVFAEKVTISSIDLSKLKMSVSKYPTTLTFKDFGYGNFRPTQNLNGRTIYKYID